MLALDENLLIVHIRFFVPPHSSVPDSFILQMPRPISTLLGPAGYHRMQAAFTSEVINLLIYISAPPDLPLHWSSSTAMGLTLP